MIRGSPPYLTLEKRRILLMGIPPSTADAPKRGLSTPADHTTASTCQRRDLFGTVTLRGDPGLRTSRPSPHDRCQRASPPIRPGGPAAFKPPPENRPNAFHNGPRQDPIELRRESLAERKNPCFTILRFDDDSGPAPLDPAKVAHSAGSRTSVRDLYCRASRRT